MPILLQRITTPYQQGTNWTENELDELTEEDFRGWVIKDSSKLKEYVLTQCKKARNLEKRLEELLTTIISLEKNISDLMELENIE